MHLHKTKIQLPGRKPATPKTKSAAADDSAAAFSCANNNDRPVFLFCRDKLRRFADLLQEIFDHIKALIRGGTLSKTAEDFALMTADRAQQLRQEFLAALDQVGENAKQGEQNKSGTKYSVKGLTKGKVGRYNSNGIRLDEQTYAMVKSALMRKNAATGKPLNRFVYVYAADQFFICENKDTEEYDNFNVLKRLNPETDYDEIAFFEGGLKNGAFIDDAKISDFINRIDTGRRYRSKRSQNTDDSSQRGSSATGVDRLRIENRGELDEFGSARSGARDRRGDDIDERVKHSLGITAASEADKSLTAKVTALEQINRDLERQVKDYRLQAQAGGARQVAKFDRCQCFPPLYLDKRISRML